MISYSVLSDNLIHRRVTLLLPTIFWSVNTEHIFLFTIKLRSCNSLFYFFSRQLAQISRSTRGVVLLLCDVTKARKIMWEAQRLNMVGGHFIWIWADTSSRTELFDAYMQANDAEDAEKEASDAQRRADNAAIRKGHRSSIDPTTNEQLAPIHQIRQRQRQQRQRTNAQRPQRPNQSSALNDDIASDYSNEIVDDPQTRVRRDHNVNTNFISKSNSSDESVGYSIDNNADIASTVKSKRVPLVSRVQSSNATTSHVLFQHFTDFPVGLLALRPVRMGTDRSFIRSTVRLFANTWANVDSAAKQRQYQDNVINRHPPRNRTDAKSSSSSSSSWSRANEQRRNRNLKRKRTISTVDQLLKGDVADEQNGSTANSSASAHTLVNSYLLINSSNDTSNNFNNIASDLNNVTLESSSSFNRNQSGLSNDSIHVRSNSVALAQSDGSEGDEGMRSAGQRPKRENTWWSLKGSSWLFGSNGDATTIAPPTSSVNPDMVTMPVAPNYMGGCYGKPSQQGIVNAQHFSR